MIFEDDLYRINRLADYEYDVDAFQDQITRAERIANPVECATALRRAIEIYGGDYCPEIEDEWSIVERCASRTALSPSALQLATLEYEMSDYAGALTTCEQMIHLDSCWEEAHRLAMSSLRRHWEPCRNRASI